MFIPVQGVILHFYPCPGDYFVFIPVQGEKFLILNNCPGGTYNNILMSRGLNSL